MNVTVKATCGWIDWKSLEWGEVWSSLSIKITKAKGEGTNCDPISATSKALQFHVNRNTNSYLVILFIW